MKRALSVVLVIALLLLVVGCRSEGNSPVDGSTAPSTSITEQTQGTNPTTETDGVSTEPSIQETTIPTEPEHIHSYTIDEVIAASCTENGYTVNICNCGESYEDNIVEAQGHNFGEWETVKEPTETAEGEAKRTCPACGEVETRVLPKTAADHSHSYTETVTKAATCSAQGVMTYTCSCGDTYTDSIPKAAHTYKDSSTAPTCTAQGYTTHTCTVCGNSYRDNYVKANGHSYGAVVTAATCTAGGYTTYTCSVCGSSYVGEKTDSLGHKWGEWVTVKEPTTTAAGTAERTCSVCSVKESKTLDKLIEDHTHNYTEKVTKAPTCTEEGVKTFTCSCGSSYTESIAKLGHNYKSTVTKPTCTAKGYTTYTCSNCNNSYKGDYTDATGHSYKSTVTAPTCTEQGYTTHTCSGCGESYTDSKVAATGHVNTTTKTVEPTCTEDGYTMTTCDDCGAPISTTTIESTGECSFTIKMNLATAVKAEYDRGYTDYVEYIQSEDFDVMVCSCGTIDISSKTFRYTDNQAANIMLNYVNELRAANGMFALEIDSSLMSLARTMVEETMLHGYPTTSTTAYCWYVDGGYNIYHHFTKAQASSQDRMLDWNYEYFAYVADTPSERYTSALYGVILMK